jgi:hypothetical protein
MEWDLYMISIEGKGRRGLPPAQSGALSEAWSDGSFVCCPTNVGRSKDRADWMDPTEP